MTDNIEASIRMQTPRTLATWWCTLNKFGWPDGLPDKNIQDNSAIRRECMDLIVEIIGFKKCLRIWNSDMTDEQFEKFWADHERQGRYDNG